MLVGNLAGACLIVLLSIFPASLALSTFVGSVFTNPAKVAVDVKRFAQLTHCLRRLMIPVKGSVVVRMIRVSAPQWAQLSMIFLMPTPVCVWNFSNVCAVFNGPYDPDFLPKTVFYALSKRRHSREIGLEHQAVLLSRHRFLFPLFLTRL